MTDRQKKICDRYSKRDADGFVHCNECPLVVDHYDYLCRKNSHYNRHTHEWGLYKIHYQCSNCGKQGQASAMVGVPQGMYYLGYRANGDALYCPDCVKSWKERNGKEFDEQYKDPPHLFAMWWNKQAEKKAPASPEQRRDVKKELTAKEGNATALQIKGLKNVLKKLRDADPTKEKMIEKIAVETEGFTVISKTDYEAIIEKITAMLEGGAE